MKGRRVPLNEDGSLPILDHGDYCVTGKNNIVYWMTPDGHMCNLKNHKIAENSDGTITVSPSIGIRMAANAPFVWHGFLEQGVWRTC